MNEDKNKKLTEIYSPFGVRDDLVQAHLAVWKYISQPGVWLTGAEKVAVAAETRAALECKLCKNRKKALSPYSVDGTHDSDSNYTLDPAITDAVHRITTDPNRLSKKLVDDLQESGITHDKYVEILGIALFTMSIDIFHHTTGIEYFSLPEPANGAPSEEKISDIEEIGAWIPVLSAGSPVGKELWTKAVKVTNVARGLSLVPELVKHQIALVEAQYVSISQIASTAEPDRAINRSQMELIASRVSALNECFY